MSSIPDGLEILETLSLRLWDDDRFYVMFQRVSLLTDDQLQRILGYSSLMVHDECNFKDGAFCPLAVAFGLPRVFSGFHDKLTDAMVRARIEEIGRAQFGYDFQISPTKSVEGDFYTTNRKEDLLNLVRFVIALRKLI